MVKQQEYKVIRNTVRVETEEKVKAYMMHLTI